MLYLKQKIRFHKLKLWASNTRHKWRGTIQTTFLISIIDQSYMYVVYCTAHSGTWGRVSKVLEDCQWSYNRISNTLNLVQLIWFFYLQPKFRFAPLNPHFILIHIHTLTFWSELIYKAQTRGEMVSWVSASSFMDLKLSARFLWLLNHHFCPSQTQIGNLQIDFDSLSTFIKWQLVTGNIYR